MDVISFRNSIWWYFKISRGEGLIGVVSFPGGI